MVSQPPRCQKALGSLRQCRTPSLTGKSLLVGLDRAGQSHCFRPWRNCASACAGRGDLAEAAEAFQGGESIGGKESTAAACRAGVVYTVPWPRWGPTGWGRAEPEAQRAQLTGSGRRPNWWGWGKPAACLGPSAAPPLNRVRPGRG